MRPWRRKRGMLRGAVRFQSVLEPAEREVLCELAATVSDSLMNRAATAPKDELSEMVGMPSGHADAPQDPRLARLLPDFVAPGAESVEGENALLRQLNESDVVRAKLENLRAILNAVEPNVNGTIIISEEDAHKWVAGINDLRLYLHVSMENMKGSLEELEQTDAVYQWLSYNQESLLEELMRE
ncbi:DUF2017 domain-containing protein [Corynebacterium sp. H113]|uniref:DUF2017 domain-containing protein n=1 Tax=Corynebacterium sp. H113 TaxID=3133419 RepID=UPI0030AA17E9